MNQLNLSFEPLNPKTKELLTKKEDYFAEEHGVYVAKLNIMAYYKLTLQDGIEILDKIPLEKNLVSKISDYNCSEAIDAIIESISNSAVYKQFLTFKKLVNLYGNF